MNKSIYIIVLLVFSALTASGSVPTDNPLFAKFLDKLDSVDVFRQRKEESISLMKGDTVLNGPASVQKYNVYMDIAGAYNKFQGDSCIVYYDCAAKTAEQMGADSLSKRAILQKINTFCNLGYFTESGELLRNIQVDSLGHNLKILYFKACYQLNYSLAFNSVNDEYRRQYNIKTEAYRDSLLLYESKDSESYLRHMEKRFAAHQQYDQAFAMNQQRLDQCSNERSKALVMYDRFSLLTKYQGMPIHECIDYLLLSSIADLESANRDVASLLTLEKYLLAIGEVSRAKQVSDYYYQTINLYGSRLRKVHGFEHAMAINHMHTEMLLRRQSQFTWALALILLFLVIAVALIAVVLKERRKIVRLNDKLEISNLASKRYVLGFFQLYSDYIERLLRFRGKINTATRRGNTNYVLEITNPDKDVNEEELKQLYKNFDAAFLDIFPDYVESFNKLLKPEFRYKGLAPGELNTELRIFALIKMGESDSGTVAKLLHCSIKTVYNKRSDIKRKLITQPMDFERELRRI